MLMWDCALKVGRVVKFYLEVELPSHQLLYFVVGQIEDESKIHPTNCDYNFSVTTFGSKSR